MWCCIIAGQESWHLPEVGWQHHGMLRRAIRSHALQIKQPKISSMHVCFSSCQTVSRSSAFAGIVLMAVHAHEEAYAVISYCFASCGGQTRTEPTNMRCQHLRACKIGGHGAAGALRQQVESLLFVRPAAQDVDSRCFIELCPKHGVRYTSFAQFPHIRRVWAACYHQLLRHHFGSSFHLRIHP